MYPPRFLNFSSLIVKTLLLIMESLNDYTSENHYYCSLALQSPQSEFVAWAQVCGLWLRVQVHREIMSK